MAGPDAPKRAQPALDQRQAGRRHRVRRGPVRLPRTLSLDVSGVTIRGQGPDKTILSFKDQGQGTGGEGLLVTSKENVTLEDLAVEDARGDAIKVQGTQRIVFRNVRTEWTGGPKETNGGYGLYPVLCTDVVIEDCKVIGASDAGIYVGQSEDIIVRRNTAREERGRHRDRELDPGRRLREPGHRQLRRHPRLHHARPAQEGRPALPRLSQQGARQQPRELRPQGQHRGDASRRAPAS